MQNSKTAGLPIQSEEGGGGRGEGGGGGGIAFRFHLGKPTELYRL
jgi:hypothetical protein